MRRLWIELGLKRPVRAAKGPEIRPETRDQRRWIAASINRPCSMTSGPATSFTTEPPTVVLKWLTLVDEYTRECLVLHAARSIMGADVRRIVARVVGRRGAATRIRSDNGSEFICETLANWLPGVGAEPMPVAAGSPWENGYIESFHSRLRDEFLERVIFEDVADARAKASWYRREYNACTGPAAHLATQRPKSSSRSLISEEDPSSNEVILVYSYLDVKGSLPYKADQKTGSRPIFVLVFAKCLAFDPHVG